MLVVIFKARVRELDTQYFEAAARMRELAIREFGCLEFSSVTEGADEVALSYWPDEESIKAWRKHPEHVAVQQLGKERWYESWSVQVATISRQYSSGTGSSAGASST